MNQFENYAARIKTDLANVSSVEKAESSRRYFPNGIHCCGANAADIKLIVKTFQEKYSQLTAEQTLSLIEYLLENAEFNEEKLIAFALLNTFVKRHYEDDLLQRFEYWLEHYADNWALVDDLCIKTIYQFLMARPHLIETTQHWAHSKVSWCRRASNVVWVKFIKRKIGKTTYYLNKELVFQNCDLLMSDSDEFVQKSIGWLLKVTATEHEADVITYLEKFLAKDSSTKIPRSTLRYAIEKMETPTRKRLLSLD